MLLRNDEQKRNYDFGRFQQFWVGHKKRAIPYGWLEFLSGYLKSFFGLLDNCLKRIHVFDCHFAQHLTVELDALLVQTMNQLRILNAAMRASSRNSYDPESSEVSFLGSSVSEGILPRFHDLLVSSLKYVFLTPEITFGLANDLLVALVAHKATFNSCHLFVSLF